MSTGAKTCAHALTRCLSTLVMTGDLPPLSMHERNEPMPIHATEMVASGKIIGCLGNKRKRRFSILAVYIYYIF